MNVIVISSHPDDEMIGCGGTLLKHKANKDKIGWVIITNVDESQGFSSERVNSRQIEIDAVAKEVGFDSVFKLNFPTTSLSSSSVGNLIQAISKVFNEFKPEVIYTVNRSDAHSDHRYTFDAVGSCIKSFRYPFIKKVMMYECLSETEFAPALSEKVFLPNHFVDITNFYNEKERILKIYESEIGEHPFPRSFRNLKALATFRGATAGVEYAEAFQLILSIDK
jgi:LmbE family N-acetylglucosaminyl deacetylase